MAQQAMDPINELLFTRRAERWLREEFQLFEMVFEPIYRERQRTDDWPVAFVAIEREALKMIGTMWSERRDR